MAISRNLVDMAALRTLLRLPSLSLDDEYARLIANQASNAVRDFAERQLWISADDGDDITGLELAPHTARDIALQVAFRAWTNPKNLERRTSGPISETFGNGAWGLELTEDEKGRLGKLRAGGARGLWVQPITRVSPPSYPILVPSSPVNLGEVYLADSDQFPYNVEP